MPEENPPTDSPADPIAALGDDPSQEDVLKALGMEPPAGEGGAGDPPPGDPGGESGAGEGAAGERSADARPDWLLPKYATVEDQAKAMVDAQKLIGKKKDAGTPPKLELPDKGEPGEPGEPGERRPLDSDYIYELGAEWYEGGGKLTPETYASLKEHYGFTEEGVNGIMQAQADRNAISDAGIMAEAGINTVEEWEVVAQWGADNLSAEEYEQISALLADTSPIRRGAAVQTLKTRFDKSRGAGPITRLAGDATGTSSLKPITGQRELTAAMDDERYYEDSPRGEKYRAEVNARIELGQS